MNPRFLDSRLRWNDRIGNLGRRLARSDRDSYRAEPADLPPSTM